MASTNFSKKNDKVLLSRALRQIDDACGCLDNAVAYLCAMSPTAESVKKISDKLYNEFENIVSLKNEIEDAVSKMQ